MKRLLACLLILAGFVLTGCEGEEGEEREHAGAYRPREYREYRLNDTTTQSDGVSQVETTVQQ